MSLERKSAARMLKAAETMPSQVALMSLSTVLAESNRKPYSWPEQLAASHRSHHTGSDRGQSWFCQAKGSLLACKISFIAWYGIHRFTTGMKYEPTAQPGLCLKPCAPSW